MSSLSSSSSSSLSSSSSSARSGSSFARTSRRPRTELNFEYETGSGSGSGIGGGLSRQATTNSRRLESVRERESSETGVLQDEYPLTAQSVGSASGISGQSRGSETRGQTWAEFLQGGGVVDSEREQEAMDRRRSATVTMDRKRRLTGAEEDLSRRRSLHGGTAFASGSGSRPEPRARSSQQRPADALPAGSSSDNAIDLSRSPESARRPPEPPSRQASSNFEYSLPRWQPDSEVSQCPICDTQFSFFYRKHHCRKCGRVVCASCSPHRITIPRQFIVSPPDQNRFPLSSTLAPNLSDAHVIDLTGDESPSQPQPRTHMQRNYSRDLPTLNPGLGGGEEVRLCNPCVPDPNPEPPRGYGSLGSPSLSSWASGTGPAGYVNQTGARRSSLADYYGSNSGLQGWNVSGHRPHHSVSSVNMPGHPRTDAERELRRQRGRGMIFQPETPEIQRASQIGLPDEGLPSYGSFDYTVLPSFRGQPPRYQPPMSASSHPYHSPPAYSSPISVPSSHHRNQSHGHSNSPGSSRSFRGRTLMYTNGQPVPTGHGRRRHIDEVDICPICNRVFPPRGPDGSEEAREEHVRTCISGHGHSGQSPDQSGTPPRPAPAPTRMLPFVATEKDCVGEDGNEMECTICMVEYEVGDELARLECLCKFHKRCIVEWFGRKQECPVHKVS